MIIKNCVYKSIVSAESLPVGEYQKRKNESSTFVPDRTRYV